MSPTDDRDIRAALSRPPNPNGTTRLATDAPSAAPPGLEDDPCPAVEPPTGTITHCTECTWEGSDTLLRGPNAVCPQCGSFEGPTEGPRPDPLREAAREAMDCITSACHHRASSFHRCTVCHERWPCDVELARQALADALEDR